MGRYFKSRRFEEIIGGSAMNILKALLSLYLVFAVILSQFRRLFIFKGAEQAIERHSLPWFYVSVFICLVI